MPVLAQRFDPRRNCFDALRLLLAALVAIDHGIIMRTGRVHEYHGSDLGDFAVDGFFVLSGFLVCRSYLRLASLPRYLWHRAVRILPGFWVCLLVTALVAAPLIAVLEGREVSTVFTVEPTALQYVTNNALLMMRQFEIAGLLADNPTPFVLDGALWTLFYEAFCYVLIAGLGVLGILARRRWLVLVATVVAWAVNVAQAVGAVEVGELSARLVLMFLLGSLAFLYAEELPVSVPWVIAAAVVFAGSLAWAGPYRLVGAGAFAYLLVWWGACAPFAVSIKTDLSYGLYIYHFLTFQILMLTPLAGLPIYLFVPTGIAVALIVATGSWYAVERPALARKNGALIGSIEARLRRAKPRTRSDSRAGH